MEHKIIKKYQDSLLVQKINNQLPLHEFKHGNFSNATTIKELYDSLVQENIAECMKEYTQREDENWNLYIKEKLTILQEKKNTLTQEYNIIQPQITTLQREKKLLLTPIQEKYHDNKGRIQLCTIIKNALDTYPTLDSIKDNAEELWKERICEIRNHIEEIIKINNKLYPLTSKRAKIKNKLDHKGNQDSIVTQIHNCYNGTETSKLQNYIAHKIKATFSGITYNHEIIEDVPTYYNEVLTTEMCKHGFLDIATCKKILHNHTDKIGVFEYFYSIYAKSKTAIDNIYEYQDIQSATQGVINKLNGYNKILKDVFRRSTQISQDEILFIEQLLLSKKTTPRGGIYRNNEKIRHICSFIAKLDIEKHPQDFENTIESIWNADYYNIFQNTEKFFDLLVYLYTIMNKEEREMIYEYYDTYYLFGKIANIAKEQIKEKNSTQGILFAFTDDNNRNYRIRILQEQINTHTIMPNTFGEEEYQAIETLVFSKKDIKIPLKYKENQYATIENRKKSRQHKQVVWKKCLEEIFEQELMKRKEFPRTIRTLQKHIIWDKEPLYEQFPVIKDQSIKG